MMRAVCSGGGTAAAASAGGNPIAGKTGTVNDHTDVWFIGYTPKYATGVWMGNPIRKENLGNNMTGGHGALPFWNAFMIPFMKNKPRESFPNPPPMPSDVKREMEMRKREELESLQDADASGRRGGAIIPTGPKADAEVPTTGTTITDSGTSTKPVDTTPDRPPIVRPPVIQSTPRPQPTVEKPAGEKRKGKKGDG